MAKSKKDFTEYYAGLNWLYEFKPHMAKFVVSLGSPRSTNNVATALVALTHKGDIELHINGEFMAKYTDAEKAGCLAHEFSHVLLSHLQEVQDKERWPHAKILDTAHEVIINDYLKVTGYELPDIVLKGEMFNSFFGFDTTDEAYDKLLKIAEETAEQDGEQSEESQGDAQAGQDSSSGEAGELSGSGAGSSQPGYSSESSIDQGDSAAGEHEAQDSNESNESNTGSEGSQEARDHGESQGESQESDSLTGDEASEDTNGSSEGETTDNTAAQDGGDSKDPHEHSGACSGVKYVDEQGNYHDLTPEQLKEVADKLRKAVLDEALKNDKPDKNEMPTDEQMYAAGDLEMTEAMLDNDTILSKRAGNSADEISEIMTDKRLGMSWVKILRMVNPDIGRDGNKQARGSYNWARQRRTTSLVPGVVLPTVGAPVRSGMGAGTKPEVLLALDFSGSVPRHMTKVMAALAKSIPTDKISVECVTFSTYSVAFNHKSESNRVASGGTDFSCVHRVALEMQKKNKGKYPHVICFTDGEAKFDSAAPSPLDLDTRWIWIDIDTNDDFSAFRNIHFMANMKNKLGIPFDLTQV